jgi:hypothetical protein
MIVTIAFRLLNSPEVAAVESGNLGPGRAGVSWGLS